MLKVQVTLGTDQFQAEGEDLKAEDLQDLFRTWVNAVSPGSGAVKLEELTDKLSSGTDRLRDAVRDNTPEEQTDGE